jgi:hypothetical protein
VLNRARTLCHICTYAAVEPAVPLNGVVGHLGSPPGETLFSGSWCTVRKILVRPSLLMLLAMASIWAFRVLLRPPASAHLSATFQLTSAIVPGRFANDTMSGVSTAFTPRYSWTMSSLRPMRASCSSIDALKPPEV